MSKRSKVVFATLTAFLVFGLTEERSPAFVQDMDDHPDACIDIQAGESNHARISNHCQRRVVVEYCIEDNANPYACSGHAHAGTSIPSGGFHQVPVRLTGELRFAACFAPHSPVRWSPYAREYSCSN